MVAPLFVISLVWDRRDWRTSRLFTHRSFTWRFGRIRRTISMANLASSLLLLAMGGWMIWAGFTSDGLTPSRGWQLWLSSRVQHYGQVATDGLAWLPGWAAVVLLALIVGYATRRAMRQIGWSRDSAGEEEASM